MSEGNLVGVMLAESGVCLLYTLNCRIGKLRSFRAEKAAIGISSLLLMNFCYEDEKFLTP